MFRTDSYSVFRNYTEKNSVGVWQPLKAHQQRCNSSEETNILKTQVNTHVCFGQMSRDSYLGTKLINTNVQFVQWAENIAQDSFV